MTLKYCDLHTHTIYSDGLNDPGSVVRNSKLKNIQILAITDHDTLASLPEAQDEAQKQNIQLIPGVEVSTDIYHILGLNIDPNDDGFNQFLLKSQRIQRDVCQQRIEILQSYGFPITLDMVVDDFPKSRLGKYNIFMSMIRNEEIYQLVEKMFPNASHQERFRKLLGVNGLAGKVQKKEVISSYEAIQQIHSAEGIAVVAHPFREAKKSPTELDSLILEGLDGLEIQPNFGAQNNPFQEYAKEKNLLVTYGSDFHGDAFDKRPLLGRSENKIDDEILSYGRPQYV